MIWKKQPSDGPVKVGQRAGSPDKEGYRTVKLHGKAYREHRLIWLYMTGYMPERDVDHDNLDKADNRFDNLSLATNSQNQANTRKWATNTSGYKGVSWSKSKKRWRSCMKHEGKVVLQRYFKSKDDAHQVYCETAKKYRGEFGRSS